MLKDYLPELKLNGYDLDNLGNQNISGRLDFFPRKSGFEIIIESSTFRTTILLKPESWGVKIYNMHWIAQKVVKIVF